ncbi:unnamed protein product [Paramecium pentaurelia]|uniref:Uncharacterized protein n=1 Tax=Paramecium pentaurelia TaxID=43138 RepID=A0A8S1TDP3_9CILI|nr:unnamed protein product [Paramecium pentaurelia]
MNAFGIKNNRFQQKAVIKKQDSIEKQNNLDKQQQNKISQQSQNESKIIQNRKESITVIGPTTPILECHVPIFEPAKFINDIKNKKL